VGADAPGGDCDDTDGAVNPDGTEMPSDGVDSNCDGLEQCYVDEDGDGYRTPDEAVVESELTDCVGDGLAGSDAPATDCDDTLGGVYPGASETVGDSIDANCDGLELCYADLDGDGYRTADVVQSLDTDCEDVGEADVDALLVDCDDSRATVNPGAEEIPGDGLDQDCDGIDPDAEGEPSGTDTAVEGDDSEVPAGGDGELTVAVEYPPEKGGCSTAGSSTPARWSWFLGLGLILGFRRRD